MTGIERMSRMYKGNYDDVPVASFFPSPIPTVIL